MFEKAYSRLIGRFPYKVLLWIPIIIAILSLGVVWSNGILLSIDFQGGTWVDITISQPVDLKLLERDLTDKGLKDLRLNTGVDLETNKQMLTIISSTLLNETQVRELLAPWINETLRDKDIAIVKFPIGELTDETAEHLKKRISERADTEFNRDTSTLTLTGFDLSKTEIENTIKYYTNASISVELAERNLVVDDFDPLLGKDFWNQCLRVLIIAILLMMLVVFIAFRDIVASFAVIISGFADVIFAAAGMSLFGIQLDPSSLVALITLVGYCVDTNILLTARVMKTKVGEVNERIDNSFGTGIAMTITTLIVMVVIMVFATVMVNMGLTPIAKLNTIASVLFLGLIADIASTWLTVTGIMKWYMEEKGGKFSFFKKKWIKKSY